MTVTNAANATGSTIPTVAGPPLVGSVLALARDPMAFLVRAHRAYGPVFRVRIGNRSAVVLAGPELARWMGSREGRDALSSHDAWIGLADEFGATSFLLSADGAEHRRLREVMRRGFSREALDGRLDELVAITDRRLDADWRPGGRVPVVRALQRLVTDQLGTLLAGEVPAALLDDVRRAALTALTTRVTRQRPTLLLRDPRYRRARARVVALGQRLIDEHSTAGALVADLVAAHDRDPELIGADDLVLAAISPYVAGLDTVANTLASLLPAVLARPALLDRLRTEADAAFAAGPRTEASLTEASRTEASLTEASLAALPAVHGAVLETMRLYPIAVAQARNAARDFTYAGHRIRAGEMIFCAITVPHFSPEFFPRPEVFDVDRYGPDRREHAAPGAYSPFGRGPHTCLGKGVADVQATLTTARLLHRLDLALDRPGRLPRRTSVPTPGPSTRFRVRVAGVRHPA